MRKFEKIIALLFSILLLIPVSTIENFSGYTYSDSLNNDQKDPGSYFSVGRFDNESPYYQSINISTNTKDLPVSLIRKTFFDNYLVNFQPVIRKITGRGYSVCLAEAIFPTITTRDIIFPSHYFL